MRTIYRIETRRQGARTKTGQFATRHEPRRLVLVEATDPAAERASLARHVERSLASTTGSAPVDRIVIERIGTL